MYDILFCFTIVLILCLVIKKYRKLPPGPYGLPVVGYYPFLGDNPNETINHLGEQYNDIMTINLLGETYWILNSYEAIEEALITKGEIFSGRMTTDFSLSMSVVKNSIGFAEGQAWKANLKFITGHLSKLGMGKSEFEITIHNLLENVEEYIEEKGSDPHDYQNILSNFTFNTITTLILSKNYDYDDPDYRLFRYNTLNLFVALEKLNMLLTGNVWKFWLKFRPNIQKILADNYNEMKMFGQKMVNERMKTYDANNCNDLLDYWIKESSGPNSEYIKFDQIGEDIAGFIMGGTDTSSSLLYHSLHLMGLYPDVQRRVFEEIDNTIGLEGLFCYLDKERMPYTQAVIAEIFRFVTLAPLGNPHVNLAPTTLRGYEVPKRTKIVTNLFGLTRNRKYFQNPHEFDPHNFLDENGNFKPNKALIHFGVGARKCMGMKLAEVEIFIAFVRLMRKFEWILPANERDSPQKSLQGVFRFMRPFRICAQRRE